VLAVVKVGTSSITAPSGEIDDAALRKLCAELVAARRAGHQVLLVSSGAIAAGLPALGFAQRPSDVETLQAVAAVGQPMLMERFRAILAEEQVLAGQVLVTPFDFVHRTQ
jgi:glutamate 5-kinase